MSTILIAGPSGSGKTSLVQALVRMYPNLTRAVTVTTRMQRPGEIDGVDYHFVTPAEFAEIEAAGEFLEKDEVYGEHYGVHCSALESTTGDVAIIMSGPGALALKKKVRNATTVFIQPYDVKEAAARVAERNAPKQRERLKAFKEEMELAPQFDRMLLNRVFDETAKLMGKVLFPGQTPLQSQSDPEPVAPQAEVSVETPEAGQGTEVEEVAPVECYAAFEEVVPIECYSSFEEMVPMECYSSIEEVAPSESATTLEIVAERATKTSGRKRRQSVAEEEQMALFAAVA